MPKPPQGVELLFPVDDGVATKDEEKDTRAEKETKRQAALLKKLKAIEEGGDVNSADKKGQTALMQAAAANNRLAVCWLVAKGAKAALKNKKGKTARDLSTSIAIRELLRLAADERKPLTAEEKVRYHVDDKPTKDDLQQSLSYTMPYAEDLANLLKMGAKPTAWDEDGQTLLKNNDGAEPESIAWLARKGVDFAERGKDGKWTGGQGLAPTTLRFLLALGAAPDPQKDDPRACLQAALEVDDIPGIRAVLEKTPELAKEKEWSDFVPYIHSKAAMKAFLVGGFDPKGDSIAIFAGLSESREALAGLLGAGATLTGGGYMAMKSTISDHRGVLLPQLLAAGGDPNQFNSGLLSKATKASDIQSLRILLAAGAKVSAESNPLLELFTSDVGHVYCRSKSKPYMDFPSRGITQERQWREYSARALSTRDIIGVLSDAGCQIPDSLPRNYLKSYLPWGRHQCPDLPPSMVNMLASPESPEKTVQELLKLTGNKISKNALLYSPFADDEANNLSRFCFTTAELIRLANLFLDAGADPKASDSWTKLTTLMTAGGLDASLCKRLLAAGADPKAVTRFGGLTALHKASNTEVAQVLLEAWSNIQEIEKETPILRYYIKTYDKHRDTLALCKFWKEHGADFDVDLSGLCFDPAYPANDFLEILKLLAGGKDLNSYRTQKTKESFLHGAARSNCAELARLLIKAGVDVNAKDKDGKTPLMRTYTSPYIKNIGYSYGASPHLMYDDGEVVDRGMVRLLLQNGANINAQDDEGNTYLMQIILSTRYNRQDACRLLLDSGAKTDIKNKDGKTALRLAREQKIDDVVKLLEERGAKE